MNRDEDMQQAIRLHAYLDGELGPTEAMALERELAADPKLKAGLDEMRAMRKRIREQGAYHAAPAALRARIGRELSGELPRTAARSASRRPRWLQWTPVGLWFSGAAAGALAVLAVLAFTLLRPEGPAAEPAFAEMLDGHLRATLQERWVDVASSDRHTVKPWLSARLGFSPSVPDLADHGFELLGGRLDVLGSHPAATLVYRRRQHMISVFVWPDSGASADTNPTAGAEQRGYHMVRWQESGMAYRAISDLNAPELMDFSRLLASVR